MRIDDLGNFDYRTEEERKGEAAAVIIIEVIIIIGAITFLILGPLYLFGFDVTVYNWLADGKIKSGEWDCAMTCGCSFGEFCNDDHKCMSGVEIKNKSEIIKMIFYEGEQIELESDISYSDVNIFTSYPRGCRTCQHNYYYWVINEVKYFENQRSIILSNLTHGTTIYLIANYCGYEFEDTLVLNVLENKKQNADKNNGGWVIDYKSTKLKSQINQEGSTYADFTGTITNLDGKDFDEIQIHITIKNDGVIPIKSDSMSSDSIELFDTKVVYTIMNFHDGDTRDWIVRSKVTDAKIDSVTYEIVVFTKTVSGWDEIYTGEKILLFEK